jgi:hypothetical protein
MFIYAWPVSYPQGSPPNRDDMKVKKWLENHGIKDVPFVVVPDPLMQYSENGADYD